MRSECRITWVLSVTSSSASMPKRRTYSSTLPRTLPLTCHPHVTRLLALQQQVVASGDCSREPGLSNTTCHGSADHQDHLCDSSTDDMGSVRAILGSALRCLLHLAERMVSDCVSAEQGTFRMCSSSSLAIRCFVYHAQGRGGNSELVACGQAPLLLLLPDAAVWPSAAPERTQCEHHELTAGGRPDLCQHLISISSASLFYLRSLNLSCCTLPLQRLLPTVGQGFRDGYQRTEASSHSAPFRCVFLILILVLVLVLFLFLFLFLDLLFFIALLILIALRVIQLAPVSQPFFVLHLQPAL